MAIFAVEYVYGPAEEQEKYRPEHRQYLGTLVEQETIIASGPYTSGDPGALLLFSADSADEVIGFIEKDPMHQGGVVLSYTVRAWNPVLGNLGK